MTSETTSELAGSGSHAEPALPIELRKYSIWKWVFGTRDRAIGDELRGYHPFIVMSDDGQNSKLQAFAHVPMTSKENHDGLEKVLWLTVDLPAGLLGASTDTKSGSAIILIPQIDSMSALDLSVRRKRDRGRACFTTKSISEHRDVIAEIDERFRHLLFDHNSAIRTNYDVYQGHRLARGTVVELREYPHNEDNRDTPASTRPTSWWVVVSSSLWLHTLSVCAKTPANTRELVRNVFAAVPIITNHRPAKGELVVNLSGHATLPQGAYCRFHWIRNRSVDRIVKVHAPVDQDALDDIDFGLRLYLGLE